MDAQILHEFFEYRDGKLFWKVSPAPVVKIGDEAGYLTNYGYKEVHLKGKRYKVHRLIYAMHNGYFPKFIDHIDCNRTNNLIENLREATMAQNNKNRPRQRNNTSGVKGVCWDKNANKWKAYCRVNAKMCHLGYHENIQDAENVVKLFREQNHAEFARHQ